MWSTIFFKQKKTPNFFWKKFIWVGSGSGLGFGLGLALESESKAVWYAGFFLISGKHIYFCFSSCFLPRKARKSSRLFSE